MESTMFCDLCRNTFKELRECPDCEGEPLLNLEDPKVLMFLADEDDRDRRKRLTLLTFAAMPLVLPMFALLFYWGLPDSIVTIGYGFTVVATTKLLEKMFPKAPRFPRLDDK